jgi:hypothetical protein
VERGAAAAFYHRLVGHGCGWPGGAGGGHGAAGFAEAWDIAIACGADLQFHTALDQAINGVTTVRVMRGGMVEVMNAPDRKVLNAALLSKARLSAALSAQAQAVKATRET